MNFTVVAGSGTLSAPSAQTNSSGYATVTLTVSQFAANVQLSVCVAPRNVPCGVVYANPVPLANQKLQPVAGGGQVAAGGSFQPLIVRVTDASSPPNSVIGASVSFLTTVMRPGEMPPPSSIGEIDPVQPAMPVILQVTESNTTTDINVLANSVPS